MKILIGFWNILKKLLHLRVVFIFMVVTLLVLQLEKYYINIIYEDW